MVNNAFRLFIVGKYKGKIKKKKTVIPMARYEIACLKNKLLVLSLRGEGKYFSF